jgi:Insecticide toxin TcdB middle/N-terminal region
VAYASSARLRALDDLRPATRWRTPLPFPVLVVARVEAIDHISGGRMVSEFSQRHGHWDGHEREFRGFGRVVQRDTETFDRWGQPGLFPDHNATQVNHVHFSPPVETRTWFHLGPVGDGEGDWMEAEFPDEYWEGDANVLTRPRTVSDLLARMERHERREALRTRGGAAGGHRGRRRDPHRVELRWHTRPPPRRTGGHRPGAGRAPHLPALCPGHALERLGAGRRADDQYQPFGAARPAGLPAAHRRVVGKLLQNAGSKLQPMGFVLLLQNH